MPEILPIAVKPLKTGGGCTPKLLTLRQAADKTTPLAEGESGSFGTELDPSAIATGSGGVPDDIADLKELISAQREDLKTAALIGQRLLDSNDELSAKLEVSRPPLIDYMSSGFCVSSLST